MDGKAVRSAQPCVMDEGGSGKVDGSKRSQTRSRATALAEFSGRLRLEFHDTPFVLVPDSTTVAGIGGREARACTGSTGARATSTSERT